MNRCRLLITAFTAFLLMCRAGAQLIRRVAPLLAAIRAAAGDADVAGLLERNQQSRYETMRLLVAILAEKPGFNQALGEERAADIVEALTRDELYLLLCVTRGWTVEEWTAWVAATLANQLFPTSSPAPSLEQSHPRNAGGL